MPQAATPESGKRLARDLRRVRESRNVTVEDLHDETKIPQGLIEAFEDKALFDHPQFNRVYLRSFIRTYANVIGIRAEVALAALEEALSDRYSGSLAVEYLDEGPAESPTPESAGDEPSADKPATDEIPSDGDRTPKDSGALPPSDATRAASEKESTEAARTEDTESPGSVSRISQSSRTGGRESRHVEDPDEWSVQSPPHAKTTPAVSKSTRGRGAGSRSARRRDGPGGGGQRWIVALVVVAVLAVLVWVIVSVTDGGDTPAAESAGAADTITDVESQAGIDPEPQADGPPVNVQPMPSLGDTIRVYVVAAIDQVDPIRVTVDDDLRRPYWVEEGDSMLFQPTERIVLEEQLDDIELRIEGVDYPADRRDEQGRIVITRDSVRTYFDSVSGQ